MYGFVRLCARLGLLYSRWCCLYGFVRFCTGLALPFQSIGLQDVRFCTLVYALGVFHLVSGVRFCTLVYGLGSSILIQEVRFCMVLYRVGSSVKYDFVRTDRLFQCRMYGFVRLCTGLSYLHQIQRMYACVRLNLSDSQNLGFVCDNPCLRLASGLSGSTSMRVPLTSCRRTCSVRYPNLANRQERTKPYISVHPPHK